MSAFLTPATEQDALTSRISEPEVPIRVPSRTVERRQVAWPMSHHSSVRLPEREGDWVAP